MDHRKVKFCGGREFEENLEIIGHCPKILILLKYFIYNAKRRQTRKEMMVV